MRLIAVALSALALASSASVDLQPTWQSRFCSCTHGCGEAKCCAVSSEICEAIMTSRTRDPLPKEEHLDVMADAAMRRAIAASGVQRLSQARDHGGVFLQIVSYRPLWESANRTFETKSWTVEEVWRSEDPRLGLKGIYGALYSSRVSRSASDYLMVLDGVDKWFTYCDPRFKENCFPHLMTLPLTSLITRQTQINRLVVAAAQPRTMEAVTLFLEELKRRVFTPLRHVYVEPMDSLEPRLPQHCSLLCPDSVGNVPSANFEDTLRKPVPGGYYIYAAVPGAVERTIWLVAVSSVVLIGSWKGSCEWRSMLPYIG